MQDTEKVLSDDLLEELDQVAQTNKVFLIVTSVSYLDNVSEIDHLEVSNDTRGSS